MKIGRPDRRPSSTTNILPRRRKLVNRFFIKNLLVFFGGKSPERDISVITGLLTLNSIDKNFILKEELVFSSPSSSAAFVGGSSLSGNELWKTEDGVSLKKLES